MQDKQVSLGKKGMDRETNEASMDHLTYTIMLNGNYEDTQGDFLNLQNEPSNLKCTGFKDGYKVVGNVVDYTNDKVYFFLHNPTTGISEIGSVDNITCIEEVKALEVQCGCDIKVILETPLERQEQISLCNYTTIITDCEDNKCLNFSLCSPFKPGNIIVKNEKCGITLYFTDNNNPPRYINIDELDKYYYKDYKDDCTEEVETTCIDCEKLRIFPLFEKPCLNPETIQTGGNLIAGIYEFLIAYTDSMGNEISPYYSITNPIHLFDTDYTLTEQAKLDYNTGLGIRLNVTDLDNKFSNYKIAVMYRSGLDGASSYFIEGLHSITDSTIVHSTNENKQRITLQELLSEKPTYLRSENMTSGKGYLMQYGMEAQKEINLQPVVNLMGAFLKWQTAKASENIYKDGVNISRFTGYMRDEVYPFSIKFTSKTGFELANLPLIPRPILTGENELISGVTKNSIDQCAPDCSVNPRERKWQFFNTATIEGTCNENNENDSIKKEETKKCIVMDPDGSTKTVATLSNKYIIVTEEIDSNNLVNFINGNITDILDVNSNISIQNATTDLGEVRTILNNNYTEQVCEPFLEFENCTEPVITETAIKALNNIPLKVEPIPKNYSDYENLTIPTCNIYQTDTFGTVITDTVFEDEYMLSTETVFTRSSLGNNQCSLTNPLLTFTTPNSGSPLYFKNTGGLLLSDIVDSTKTAVPSTVMVNFDTNIHKSAIWYTVDFGTKQSIVIEISPQGTCPTVDNLGVGSQVRINTFNQCSSTSAIEGSIINTTGGQITLTRSNYSSNQVVIAIDIPYVVRNIQTTNDPTLHNVYTLTPPCSCLQVVQRDEEYTGYKVYTQQLDFYKEITWKANCSYEISKDLACDQTAEKYGLFSYWESEETYPCNDELYNSSKLIINRSDLPIEIQSTFENYYVSSTNSTGTYTLNNLTDFKDRKIRHYKFPDNTVVPFMENSPMSDFQETNIYPIGVHINNKVVETFLDVAVSNGLITQEDRNNIYKYEIFRGDRRTQKSIIAKGLGYDMYKYTENNKEYHYANFPYNSFGIDPLHNINHPHNSNYGDKFTFHSPDTSFDKPKLGSEIKIEGYQYGKSEGKFTEVKDHPTWVIMSDFAYNVATALGVAEAAFEALITSSDMIVKGAAGGNSAPISAPLAVGLAAAIVVGSTLKVGGYRYQWLQTFKNLGTPKNYASYYSSYGYYNEFKVNTDSSNLLRGVCSTKYLKDGRIKLVENSTLETININNIDRESSVFLSLGQDQFKIQYPTNYKNFDNYTTSKIYASKRLASDDNCNENAITKNIASPYISIKNYLPNQYGGIDNIKWINTGYCGDLRKDNSCEIIFGGDIYISRFSMKRKIPMFLTTAMDQAPLTPFQYSTQKNIPSLKYFVDYETNEDGQSALTFLLPDSRTSTDNMDCLVKNPTNFYIDKPAKFYTSYYGIPYFLVESEINCNTRYGKREMHERFYPQVTDYVDWTQETNVSIREPNTFFFNTVYKTDHSFSRYRTLPSFYSEETYKCLYDLPNGGIYSEPDVTENNLSDPWLTYKPLNKFEFPNKYGKLVDLSFIESEQLLGRFHNQIVMFNKLNPYSEGLTANNNVLGDGSLFNERPLEFNSTDLGYAGTQHKAKVSCEYGHFWTDTKRGQVFQMQPNGKGLNEITVGLRNWFKEHLPFKIMKYNIKGLTMENLDNQYNSLGIVMGWDAKNRRVFLTKKDYKVKEGCTNNIEYDGCEFYVLENDEKVTISLQDTSYFEDVSFTLAYSPITKTWISYYSFHPDYYISYDNYFQTGLNNSSKTSKEGLWSHLLTNQSYQVFYGELEPWTIELPTQNKYNTSIMDSVEYWMETRNNFSNYDFNVVTDKGFNKVWLYNNTANTGQLNLVKSEENNLYQKVRFPVFNTDSVDILSTNNYNKWNFNYIYNFVRKGNQTPVWNHDSNDIHKTINTTSMDFRSTYKNRLQGDWFLTRFQQDAESRYKMIFKWKEDNQNFIKN